MLSRSCKIVLILALSSCAGTPPKLEHPVTIYGGMSDRQEMCGIPPETLTAAVKRFAKHQRTKAYAQKIVNAALVKGGVRCVKANSPEFDRMVGFTAEDWRVLQQFQEELIFSCEKWK